MHRTSIALLSFAVLATRAAAQCPTWQPGFDARGPFGDVRALATFDDGSAPVAPLYVGGLFRLPGETLDRKLARWNGAQWSAITGAPSSMTAIEALAVFDDGLGSGPVLYVGSSQGIGPNIKLVSRFDGATWTFPLPSFSAGSVDALAVFDDGQGPALFAGGSFTTLAGAATNIVRWDGTSASAVGGGVTGGGIRALAVHDDGTGPALYAAGGFTSAGGQAALRIARFDGVSWSPLGSGIDGGVFALASFDDGSGPALFAAGDFSTAGGTAVRGIAKWQNATWSSVGDATIGGTLVDIYALHVFDAPGIGPALYASGHFDSNPSIWPTDHVKRWNGTSWSSVTACPPSAVATDLAIYDDGSGPALVAGGSFAAMGCAHASGVARFDGNAWSSFGGGASMEGGVGSTLVYCFENLSTGASATPSLYAGGRFEYAGSARAPAVARWNGSDWEALGDELSPGAVYALAAYDDGSGSGLEIYAGGFIAVQGVRSIAKWNGAAWQSLSPFGFAGDVNALAVFDDGLPGGKKLYVGGNFSTFFPQENVQVHGLASWDGQAWRALHIGSVNSLRVFDDRTGHGERLFIGGFEVSAFDGTFFESIGSASGGPVYALAEFDDGSGPALYAGGGFTQIGGVAANGVAKWNGSAWSSVGDGVTMSFSTVVRTLGVFDDGTGFGPALYVAGNFASVGPIPTLARGIAKWDGQAWHAVDQGLFNGGAPGFVAALGSIESGPEGRPALFAGGLFDSAGGKPSLHVALLSSCDVEPGDAFCFGDGSLATPCPCVPPNTVPNPSGASDAGCANSFHLSGGKLEAHGFVADDTVTLRASDLSPFGFTQFFVGDNVVAAGFAVGDGVRCADGALLRFGGQNADLGTARYPKPSAGWTLPLSTFGVPPSGGPHVRTYQALYRNSAAGFCGPGTINVTNAYGITWN